MATNYKFNYGKFFRTIIILLCLVTLSIFGKDVFERHFFNTRLTVIPDVVNLDKKDAIKYLKQWTKEVNGSEREEEDFKLLIPKPKKFHWTLFTIRIHVQERK